MPCCNARCARATRFDEADAGAGNRSEEHTSELQSRLHIVCRLLLEKKKKQQHPTTTSPLATSHTGASTLTPTPLHPHHVLNDICTPGLKTSTQQCSVPRRPVLSTQR